MSELARKNGWRGFDGLGERVKGGYEYRCDGMPSPMGCGESVTVSRAWTTVGIKKSSWCVCYGENEDGSFDVDVVLTFCPPCAQYVATPVSTHPTDPHTKPLGTSPEPVKSGLDSSHMDHANGSQ